MAQNTYTDDRKKANELLAKLSIPRMKNKTAIIEQIVLVSIIGLAYIIEFVCSLRQTIMYMYM